LARSEKGYGNQESIDDRVNDTVEPLEKLMRGRISALKIEIDSETRKLLQGWLRRQKTPIGLAKRARGMLLLADGLGPDL
jgi:hypothetical protein